MSASFHPSHPEAFRIEEAGRIPTPGSSAPEAFAFSPDGRQLTFLYSPERTLVNQLQLFPDERHSPRSLADRVFMEENIRDFFLDALTIS